jgi:hypothetical protein
MIRAGLLLVAILAAPPVWADPFEDVRLKRYVPATNSDSSLDRVRRNGSRTGERAPRHRVLRAQALLVRLAPSMGISKTKPT